MAMSLTASSLPDDPAALKAMILQLQATLRAHDLLVQSLRLRIARLKRQAFGKGSEKIAREIEQLEFALESLQVAQAEVAPPPEPESVETAPVCGTSDEPSDNEAPEKAPRRRPRVPPDTPRERREFDPGETCPDYGGTLRLVGECVPSLARGAALPHPTVIKAGRGHPLHPRPLAGPGPVPRGRTAGDGHQPGREPDPQGGPHTQKCVVRRSRGRRRELGNARLARGHLQDERREPGELYRRNPTRDPQWSPGKPDRRPDAVALPEDVKPSRLGDRRGAYRQIQQPASRAASLYIFETNEEVQQIATPRLWTYNNRLTNMGIGGVTPTMKLKMAA